ncbi:hypothetical protein DL93DRAFT_2232708 [Clavulina sp. PMI_390]|nr:hypothetical protein DL93DRAFT_2232708 [Clavulina sp. PMI_390]
MHALTSCCNGSAREFRLLVREVDTMADTPRNDMGKSRSNAIVARLSRKQAILPSTVGFHSQLARSASTCSVRPAQLKIAQESIEHKVKSSPAVRLPAAVEISIARSVISRFVAPRCNNATLLAYSVPLLLTSSYVVLISRPRLTQYRERVHLRKKVLQVSPLIDVDDRGAERSLPATFPDNPRREPPHRSSLRYHYALQPLLAHAPLTAPATGHAYHLSIPHTTPFDRAVSEASDHMSHRRDQARNHIDRLLLD